MEAGGGTVQYNWWGCAADIQERFFYLKTQANNEAPNQNKTGLKVKDSAVSARSKGCRLHN